MGAYIAIIAISVVIILSYFFNILSSKTNVPSVLMLILLGVVARVVMNSMGYATGTFIFKVLEVLGIVGLIMIVLEAALDLELKKEKWPLIWKSFSVAAIALLGSSLAIAFLLQLFLVDSFFIALIYAVPLSIMSSAIIIPSVGGLESDKREFMVYESTFSDILGIMFFYFLVGNAETESASTVVMGIFGNIFLTVTLSIVISYGLVLVFQNVGTQIKLFLLIAVLLFLYSVGKLFHLSSLLIILVFGLVLNNYKTFFKGKLASYVKHEALDNILHNFHIITIESAFVIRTFFFVIFGVTIDLASLLDIKVALISAVVVGLLFGVRYLLLKVFVKKDIFPQLYIAPRGLITILLFFAIPMQLTDEAFNPGILLYTILITSIIMAIALIRSGKGLQPVEEIEGDYWQEGSTRTRVTTQSNTYKTPPPTAPSDISQ